MCSSKRTSYIVFYYKYMKQHTPPGHPPLGCFNVGKMSQWIQSKVFWLLYVLLTKFHLFSVVLFRGFILSFLEQLLVLSLFLFTSPVIEPSTERKTLFKHFAALQSQHRFSYQLQWRESFLASEAFNFPLSCCAEELTGGYKDQQRSAAKQITAHTLMVKTWSHTRLQIQHSAARIH